MSNEIYSTSPLWLGSPAELRLLGNWWRLYILQSSSYIIILLWDSWDVAREWIISKENEEISDKEELSRISAASAILSVEKSDSRYPQNHVMVWAFDLEFGEGERSVWLVSSSIKKVGCAARVFNILPCAFAFLWSTVWMPFFLLREANSTHLRAFFKEQPIPCWLSWKYSLKLSQSNDEVLFYPGFLVYLH